MAKVKKEKLVKVIVMTEERRPELPKETAFRGKIELPEEVAEYLASGGYVKIEK